MTKLNRAALRPAADGGEGERLHADEQRHPADGRRPDRLTLAPLDDHVAPPRRRDDGLAHRQVRGEVLWSSAAIAVTLASFVAFLATYGVAALADIRTPVDLIRAGVFLTIVLLLVYGGLVYLCARLGYMRRRSAFRHASSDELQEFVGSSRASVSILIPVLQGGATRRPPDAQHSRTIRTGASCC